MSLRRQKKPITVYDKNPYYLTYNGEPILLLGGSDEDNLFNFPEMMKRNLEILKAIGGNYIRCTLSSRDEGNVWPYERVDGFYDLDRFNSEYWRRLNLCLKEAETRDIIVQIEFWATFDFYRENWLKNPFNPENNWNYTTENTRLVERRVHHPAHRVQPFFYSVPELNNDEVLLKYQQDFVCKVLETSLNYPNVLYCLDNETSAPPEWAWYWARFIRDKAGQEILLTEMWDMWDLTGEQHKATYMHPELFNFFDISQNNWQEGRVHYDRIMWIRRVMESKVGKVLPLTNVKVYGCRKPRKPCIKELNLDRWWQNIFAGCASTRFHRPPSGIGLDDTAQLMIKAARIFTSAFDIFSCKPRPDLLSECKGSEAYCLVDPGRVYAVYFPRGGEARLSIENQDRKLTLRWFNPLKATFLESTAIKEKKSVRLKTPTKGCVWLALIDRDTNSS